MGYPHDPQETLDLLSSRAAQNEINHGFRDDIKVANELDRLYIDLLGDRIRHGTGYVVTVDLDRLGPLIEAASAAIKRNMIGMKLALAHSELSEALSRSRDLTVEQLLGGDEEFQRELADTLVRVLGLSDLTGGNIGRTTFDVMKANEARPHKHGREA